MKYYMQMTAYVSPNQCWPWRLLSAIEEEGEKYGLKLNRGKCEYLSFAGAGPVKFRDGTYVNKKDEVKYLGCLVNCLLDRICLGLPGHDG